MSAISNFLTARRRKKRLRVSMTAEAVYLEGLSTPTAEQTARAAELRRILAQPWGTR